MNDSKYIHPVNQLSIVYLASQLPSHAFKHSLELKSVALYPLQGAMELGENGVCVPWGPNAQDLSLHFFFFFPSLVTISYANP